MVTEHILQSIVSELRDLKKAIRELTAALNKNPD